MKKNRTMRIATLMLALTLITCCFVGSTFAKYTSEFNAERDSARVAKWAFTLGGDAGTETADYTFTFNLFDVVYDLDNSNNVSANVDTDIDNDEVLIAPGCGGSVSAQITNSSEVNAKYTVDFTVNEAGVAFLEWSLDNVNWEDDIEDLSPASEKAIAMNGGNDTIQLYYRWVFGDPAHNTDDTTLGLAGTAMPTIDVKVTVEQVD